MKLHKNCHYFVEAAWLSGQRVRLAIRQSWAQVPLWLFTGFVLSRSEFKSLASLVNSQLVAGLQIMAGQRTMSGLIVDLTGQTPVLPVILTGHFWI